MNNIFEGTKIGDKFITRDGRIAKYCFKGTYGWWFVLPNGKPFLVQGVDGSCHSDDIFQLDIVSRYQEPIVEEKLNALAKQWCPENGSYREGNIETQRVIRNAYKACQRSAFNNNAKDE